VSILPNKPARKQEEIMKKIILCNLVFMLTTISNYAIASTFGYNKCPYSDGSTVYPMDGNLPCILSGKGGSGSTLLQIPGPADSVSTFTLRFTASAHNTAPTNFGFSYKINCSLSSTGRMRQIGPVQLKPNETFTMKISTNCTYDFAVKYYPPGYETDGSFNIYQVVDFDKPLQERVFVITKED
jgi:hypothetical protein